ncbi:MAG: carbohydrate-binding family 9-like protein [Ginsengibacter sp.]
MKVNKGLFTMLTLMSCLFFGFVNAQLTSADYDRLLQIPLQYTVLKTSEKIVIDGKDDEKDWSKAPWTPMFTDIASGVDIDSERKVQCKMLWDDDFLYLFARLKESNLWASLTEHDDHVFQDNAFEMFIDPGGSTHNYFEFQINAIGAVWDLFMPKPYRNGGKNLTSWDIKGLQKAVQLDGTINNPSDTDKGWNIELAIPFTSVSMSGNEHPGIGTTWRMNFSRVQWDIDTLNGQYFRKVDKATGKLLPEHYTVWSPQGIINLHYPERWGYARFSDKLLPGGFLAEKTEDRKLILWKYYYLQQEYRNENGKYAGALQQLDKMYSGGPVFKKYESNIKMYADEHQFWIQSIFPDLNKYISIDEEGELHIEDVSK